MVERVDQQQRAAERATLDRDHNASLIRLMIDKLDEYLRIFEEHDFHDVVLAAKSPDPRIVIDAYTAISERYDYPLHLGVTHAGPPETGRIRSITALGTLLAGGIGDTIRISYAADPVHEVEDGKELALLSGAARPHRAGIDRLPDLRAARGRSVQAGRRRAAEAGRGDYAADQGGGDGLRGERAGGVRGGGRGDLRRQGQGDYLRAGREETDGPEEHMLDALLEECREFARQVNRGGVVNMGEDK